MCFFQHILIFFIRVIKPILIRWLWWFTIFIETVTCQSIKEYAFLFWRISDFLNDFLIFFVEAKCFEHFFKLFEHFWNSVDNFLDFSINLINNIDEISLDLIVNSFLEYVGFGETTAILMVFLTLAFFLFTDDRALRAHLLWTVKICRFVFSAVQVDPMKKVMTTWISRLKTRRRGWLILNFGFFFVLHWFSD